MPVSGTRGKLTVTMESFTLTDYDAFNRREDCLEKCECEE